MRWLLILCLLCAPAFADDAPDEASLKTLAITPSPWRDFKLTLNGYLRVRAELWHDLDLSRGPTPSGPTVFPVPAAGGDDHLLTAVDMRLRLEPKLEIGQAVRIHMRLDVLDNVGWGSTPDVLPSTTAFAAAAQGTESPSAGFNAARDAVRVKQAWGEVILPFGTLSAGRMGGLISWGTGFFVNNGDCLGCDRGDSGDRVALTVPLLGHLVTALYELSASGPYVSSFGADIPIERRAQVNTAALSVAKYLSPEAQLRRLRAGKTLIQYGILASYRRQALDAPAWTQPGGLTRSYGPNDFVARGLSSFAGDLWIMLHKGGFRAELEFATVIGQIDDATNTPGVSFRSPVTSRQFGGVFNIAYQFRSPIRLRMDIGVASGDDAPGFGTRIQSGQLVAQPGDLDGPQLRPPVDNTADNFRFSPDFHVDLILWRRILGQVTDAFYIKPTLRAGPFGSTFHHFTADFSVIDSTALFATSTPGNDRHLGVEVDVRLRYRYEAGFEVNLNYGVLFPGAGFRNVGLNLDAQPAQTLELILAYRI